MPGGWRIGRDGRRERTPPWVAVVLPPSVLDNPGGLEAVPGGWLDTRIWSTRPSRVEPVGVPYVQWGVQFRYNTFNVDGNQRYERHSSVFLLNKANCDVVDECSRVGWIANVHISWKTFPGFYGWGHGDGMERFHGADLKVRSNEMVHALAII